MPNRSSFISADSRQSSRTSHVRQTFLASLVDPPFSGKNASGSVCAHSARSCHPASSASGSRRKSSLIGQRPFRPCIAFFDPVLWSFVVTLCLSPHLPVMLPEQH